MDDPDSNQCQNSLNSYICVYSEHNMRWLFIFLDSEGITARLSDSQKTPAANLSSYDLRSISVPVRWSSCGEGQMKNGSERGSRRLSQSQWNKGSPQYRNQNIDREAAGVPWHRNIWLCNHTILKIIKRACKTYCSDSLYAFYASSTAWKLVLGDIMANEEHHKSWAALITKSTFEHGP
jgi:hypothetical protein